MSPATAAIGASDELLAVLIDSPRVEAEWFVEAGEERLFSLPDLRATQLRVGRTGLQHSTWLSAAVLASPVGSEVHSSVESVHRIASSLMVSVGFSAWSLSMPGYTPASLFTASAGAGLVVTERLHVVYSMDHVRVAGEPLHGADSSVFVILLPPGNVTVVTGLHITRDGEADAWTGAKLGVTSRASGAVGYDHSTSTVKAALSVRVASIQLSAGAASHPVLGLSKSVFVRWVH
jgi:hypothetical protein